MKTVKRRAYRSERRRGQAEETRRRILVAARKRFLEDGYGATTIDAIAGDAGVAPQTVYAAFAAKRGILIALLDEMGRVANIGESDEAFARAAGDPRAQLRSRIAFGSRLYAGGIDLIEIARTVSGVEPDLAAMWNEGEGRRYRAISATVDEWRRAGALRAELTAREAIDIFWALGGPDTFRLLVVERRWSRRRYEAWLSDTLAAALFKDDA